MKKLLLFFIVFALFGGGIYFFLKYQQKDRNVDVWFLPPRDALFVYESNQLARSWNRLVSQPYWENLSRLPFMASLDSQLKKLDSLAGKNGNLERLFRDNALLVSAHLASSDEFGYVFYFKIPDPDQLMLIRTIISHFSANESYTRNERKFAGYDIHELTNRKTGEIFSYLLVNNHFAGSFSPFLIEDVIRNLDSRGKLSFFNRNGFFDSVNKVSTDDGNLYIDAKKIPQIFEVFFKKDNLTEKALSGLAASMFFDVEMENDYLLLDGTVSVPPDSNYYLLSTFTGQKAKSFDLSPLVPARAAVVYKYSFSDPVKWQRDLNTFWNKSQPAYLKARLDFEQQNELSAPLFNSWIGAGIGHVLIESVIPDHPDQLVYLAARDLNEGLNRFNRLAELSAERNSDTVFVDLYGSYKIGMIDIPNVPEMIFGPQFSGFEQCYFTVHDNYIILSNRIGAIKSLLADIETENVWGKSIRHSRFLENTLPESNVSAIFNTERAWNLLLPKLSDAWKELFREYEDILKNLEFTAIQFNQVDNRFYSAIISKINHEKAPETDDKQLVVRHQVIADAPIATKPFIVKNHNDKSLEVLLQDSLNQIYLISKDGEILWKLLMQKPIRGDVYQIDYFNNGKLQYLYADESSIKLIDRNGNFVDGFPMHFPDSIKIQTLSVIDYDNSKRYRMLVADTRGRLYMFNMQKEMLEGWSPLTLNDKVALPPRHIRVRGRDILAAIGQKGTVHLLNRRGEYYEGFPLDLNTEMISPMFFQTGSSFSNAIFNAINQNGTIIQFNLYGKTVNSQQLYKPSKETKFILCPDAMNQTFAIARQDYNRLSILDGQGNMIFQKDYVTSGDLAVQYFHYSNDNRIFVVTDKIQEFSYIYDGSGELINSQPIESSFEIGMAYSDAQKSFQVYSCFGNVFALSSFVR